MAQHTKKVGSVGRFGPRYGVRDRMRTRDMEVRMGAKHICPNCGAPKVERVSTALFQCRKCKTKFTGGAYLPRTDTAIGVEKQIQGVVEKMRSLETGEGEEA